MRRAGWESRLAAYLADAKPFSWGTNDCALWTAGWVRECTDHGDATDWFDRYRSASGALKLLRRRGYRSVTALADAHLDPKPVVLAKRGDLVLHPSDSMGICNGRLSHFISESGPLTERTLACLKAWSV